MFKNFKTSAKYLKNTRVLCISAILAAMFVVLYSIKIPLGFDLRISFTFVPVAIAGWLFGAIPAILVGAVGDIVGFLLTPQGSYFPGFTLTQILTGLIFGIFLYGKNDKKLILPVIFSKTVINLLLNVVLNSLWLAILYKKAWGFYAFSHLVKNAISLPVEIIILIALIGILHSNNIEKMYKSK